ncbi:unnamed protein product [Brassica oleracea var. botrytis]|uniref:(rape) hypothetical protein n=1 Tax=Brassica napus TaxID=3708 RepID=A0A816NC07_BRANA|nr:unnamed protein product [Brassica napus]
MRVSDVILTLQVKTRGSPLEAYMTSKLLRQCKSIAENSKAMEQETEKADKEITTVLPTAQDVVGDNSDTGQRVKEEVKEQFWLSAPLIGVSLLQYSLQVISVI